MRLLASKRAIIDDKIKWEFGLGERALPAGEESGGRQNNHSGVEGIDDSDDIDASDAIDDSDDIDRDLDTELEINNGRNC
ncbi:hypothetical protein V6N11_050218 [Hibiscus sabdariffa]|uniref:Uncharacterized protein n=1 Tax=Hibiscus sabdariffa TaxID=183260 RepID=A0ABR2T9W4_9ROSI